MTGLQPCNLATLQYLTFIFVNLQPCDPCPIVLLINPNTNIASKNYALITPIEPLSSHAMICMGSPGNVRCTTISNLIFCILWTVWYQSFSILLQTRDDIRRLKKNGFGNLITKKSFDTLSWPNSNSNSIQLMLRLNHSIISQAFKLLLAKLGSWDLAQTLTKPT